MGLPSELPAVDVAKEFSLIVKPGERVLHFRSDFGQQRHGGIGRPAAFLMFSTGNLVGETAKATTNPFPPHLAAHETWPQLRALRLALFDAAQRFRLIAQPMD